MRRSPLSVTCDDLALACRAIVPGDPRGVIVLLHGIPTVNPRDPDDLGYPGLAAFLAEEGWAAVWGDMRAVRESPGHFSIEGWVRDAEAIVGAARGLQGVAGLPLVLVGSSAGGAVAAEVTRRGAPVDALVLLAAPAAWISFAGDPRAALRRITEEAGMVVAPEVAEDPSAWAGEFSRVSGEEAIRDVRVPTLVVHGTADDVVPYEHARRIAQASPAPGAHLRLIEGAGHQLRREPEAVQVVLEWLDRTLPR